MKSDLTTKNSTLVFLQGCWDKLWSGPSLHRTTNWIWVLGALALMLYAATAMTFDYFGERAKIILLLCGLFGLVFYSREFLKTPFIWLLIACLLLQIISWGFSWLYHPEWAEASPKPSRLARWFMFLPVAWLLGGSLRNVFMLWIIALIGLAASPWLVKGGVEDLLSAIQGNRASLGLYNAQHGSLLYGIELLGLLVFAKRIIVGQKYWRIRACIWLALVCYFSWLFFATQSRGAILGLSLGVATALLIMSAIVARRFSRRHRTLFAGMSIGAFMVLLVASLMLVGSITLQRNQLELEDSEHPLVSVLRGDWDLNPNLSTGIRLNSWREAWPWIKERPLVGWGGRGRGLVIENSTTLPDRIKSNARHLHNSYLDMLVNFGVFSLVLLAVLMTYLLVACTKIWNRKQLPTDVYLFFLVFSVFWLIVNMFESFLFYASGLFVFTLVVGGIVSQIWRAKQLQEQSYSK